MNKTVNINLGGMFFHIDEDAFQKLTRYFDAIKRSLNNSGGQDEIIKDIEMRIAEIISEKHTNDKQVINLREVDEVIAIMGQPEDYRLEDEPQDPYNASQNYTRTNNRKLYRDTEKGMIGGVATGLGHYFGIQAVWIRVFIIVLVFLGYGTGILAYIILWIVTPAAVTTTEKLEMHGEPVTISNIEKKVREEFDNLSEKFKNGEYANTGKRVKTGFEKATSNVGDALLSIFKIFAKILGGFIVLFSALSLIGFVIALLTFGSTSFGNLPWHHYADAVNYTDSPLWMIALLSFVAIAVPFFFLLILGLKLLITNLKPIGSIFKYTLLALWLVAVGLLIALGVSQATEMSHDGKVVKKERLAITPSDTLNIRFAYNDFYAKNVSRRHNYLFTQDENSKELIYSNEIDFHVMPSATNEAYLQIERKANGKSYSEANKRADKIKYSYKLEGNNLILDNYLLTDQSNKYRDQEVEIYLYLPKGTIFRADSSIDNYNNSDDEFFDYQNSSNYLYQVDNNAARCVNCPSDDSKRSSDYSSEEDSSATLIINKNGVMINANSSDSTKTKFKGLRINEKGIIIKR